MSMMTHSTSQAEVLRQLDLVPGAARPFLKWAGGKQQLMTQFIQLYPPTFARYIEPFVGGGAVFFHLWNLGKLSGQVFLLDTNDELITTYQVVRDQVEELIELLAHHARQHDREYYYTMRSLDRDPSHGFPDLERAARMLYLNRTCYNGLYRVNGRGQFNVPMGSYRDPRIVHSETLRAASIAIQNVSFQTSDFRAVEEMAQPGDFFYFDPPYDPVSKTASFTSYTSGSFTDKDQQDLAGLYTRLSKRGCLCMLSNACTPFILRLYHGYRLERVEATRAINSNGNRRGHIDEVVVLNY